MMCGVVTVSARNHDVDMFIENGVNGFYGDTAEELRAQLRYLVRTPDVARAMGARARETAMRVFNIERFLGEWARLVRDVAA
jgi:glycosyltransferase involved in cell wall biosynthesis